MPKGDKTGPAGQGPKTGRAAGYCAGYDVPGYLNPGFGMGRGSGRGFGWRRFWGCPFYSPKMTEKEEVEVLQDEVKILEEELQATKERLAELKKE